MEYQYVPMKQKYLKANQGRLMTKDLHKAVMKRSRLRNKFLRDRTEMSRKEYRKRRNFCGNLLKKAKREHFANLDVNSVSDSKKFWQLFSNKLKSQNYLTKILQILLKNQENLQKNQVQFL